MPLVTISGPLRAMSRFLVDAALAKLVGKAVQNGEEIIRSAPAKFGTNPTTLHNRVKGKVEVGSRPGPQTKMSEAEELETKELLVYAHSHCFGIHRPELG